MLPDDDVLRDMFDLIARVRIVGRQHRKHVGSSSPRHKAVAETAEFLHRAIVGVICTACPTVLVAANYGERAIVAVVRCRVHQKTAVVGVVMVVVVIDLCVRVVIVVVMMVVRGHYLP